MSKKKTRTDQSLPLKERIKPSFKERFLEMFSYDEKEYNKFIDTILLPQKKSFRINTFKTKAPEKLIENLKEKDLELTPIPWTPLGFFVEYDKEKRYDLGNLFEHFLGKIYVQEATSMTPPLLLDIPDKIPSNFKVLDMCASPGSKTTQLADLMKNQGILIANELDYRRLGPLKINLERSGFSNIVITHNDARNIEGEEEFDRILLDAPCSGSGVIRKSPGTIDSYNPKKLKSISSLQLQILNKAFSLLKKGGILTYSTCSLDPEENEILIKRFLEQYENAELLPAKLEGIILSNKISQFQEIQIPEIITTNTIRIWPQDNDTNGFFVAKIKKS